MKALATFLIICLEVSLHAFPAFSDTLNRRDSLGKRQGHWQITAAMSKRTDFPTPTSITEEGCYLNDKKTGEWIQYYTSGKPHIKLTYQNNRPNGPAITYFENGHVKEIGTWVGVHWVGEYKMYYENDTLRQHFFFDPIGRRDSLQKAWWPNGKVMYYSWFSDGKQEGWTIEYDEDGNITNESFYVNGHLTQTLSGTNPVMLTPTVPEPAPPSAIRQPQSICNGYAVLYNSNKQLIQKGTFKNCKLFDGEERLYDSNGLLIQIRLYKDGQYFSDSPLPSGTDD